MIAGLLASQVAQRLRLPTTNATVGDLQAELLMAVGVDGGLCAGLSAVILRVGTFSPTPTTRPSSATRPRFVAVPSCVVGLRLRKARFRRNHSVGAGHCVLIDKGVALALQEGDA